MWQIDRARAIIYIQLLFIKGESVMKKISRVIYIILLATLLSGCVVYGGGYYGHPYYPYYYGPPVHVGVGIY